MQIVNIKMEGDVAWPELDPAKGDKVAELPTDTKEEE